MNGLRNPSWAGRFLSALIVAGVLTALAAMPQKNDQAEVLLQSAIHKEMVDGELEQAIDLYKQIVASYASNRPVAAKALLQMGQCYEKLGKDEARKAYERLVRDYADQADLVAQARTRLAALRKPAGPGKASGTILRQIKFDGLEWTPFAQLSPDGKKMLYPRREEGEPPITRYNLRIMDLSSGEDQLLVEDFGELSPLFRWSSDGSKVVYTCTSKWSQLRVISAKGGESQLMWSSSNPEVLVMPLDWSRDGQSILMALSNVTERTTRLAILPAEGGEPRVVVSGKSGELDSSGQFSPDGKFIAGHRRERVNTDIYVWAADNGQEMRVTEHPGPDVGAFWSPDGKYLVFVSDRAKTMDLWAVPMSEGRPRGAPFRVKQDLGKNALLTGFTAAGQLTMIVTGEGTPSDLFVLPVDPSTGEARGEFAPFANYPTGGFSLRWSPDGKRVAYTSRKGQIRMPSIFVSSIGGKEEEEIRVEGCYIRSVEWSPDGKHLIFPGVRGGDVGIFRVSLEDHQITPLHLAGRKGPGSKGGIINFQWLPRANKFIFEQLADANAETFDIYTMDSDGKQVQLVAEKVASPILAWFSPDGRQIPYHQGPELKLLNLADKSSMTLATIPPRKYIGSPAWSPDARRVAFTDTRQLKVLSVGEGTSKVLVEAPEGFEMGDLPSSGGSAWSPDGSRIAYLLQDISQAAGGKSELWVVPAAGGRPQRIATAPASHRTLRHAHWHPNGSMIVVTGYAGDIATGAGEQKKGLYQHWVMENFLPPAGSSK